MRDINLDSDTDGAYTDPSPGGIASDTTLTDPSYTDTKAYTKPSLGGEFGPGRAALLGAPADGGVALLAVPTTPAYVAKPPPLAPIIWPGRAANNTSFLNLYPWKKTPPEGLDMNNPNPPPAPAPSPSPSPPASPPTGVNLSGVSLSAGEGHAQFSGPAARDAIVTLTYAIDGGMSQSMNVPISAGDTGTQIAAKVRNTVDPIFGIDATGTGGSIIVVGLGGDLTSFDVNVS